MWDIFERPLYRVMLSAMYVVNAALLCGIAYLATDPHLDWHDWCYPASVGAAMLVGLELMLYQWNSRRSNPDSIESDRWLWIITAILLAATCATWLWTNSNHNSDLAEIQRQQSAPLPARYDPNLMQNLQQFQQLKQHP